MNIRIIIPWALVAVCVAWFVSQAEARQIDTSHPPVFTELGLEDAKKRAAEEKKLLVVKATAAWCGPCRTMDKTTWRDAKVEAWFTDNGIAIQLDVDKKPKDAQSLRVRAMPTMIAIKDGAEVGRVVGMQSADQMLAWLARVEKGEAVDAGLAERLKKARDDPKSMSMQERLGLADELVQENEFDDAAAEYAWLWDNMAKYEPPMIGVRGSFLVGRMEKLAADHEPAKAKFRALRDKAWAIVEDKSAHKRERNEAIRDWADMNSVVGEGARTLEWYDNVAVDPEWDNVVRSLGHRLRDLLEENQRWADLGMLLESPEEVMTSASFSIDRESSDLPDEMKDMAPMLRQQALRHFRESVSKSHAAYLAANRQQAAETFALAAIKKDDTPAMRVSLVRWAIKAKQPRESQRAWLDQAAAAGEDWPGVRKALDEALANTAKP